MYPFSKDVENIEDKMKLSTKLFCYFLISYKGFSAFASTNNKSSYQDLSTTRIGLGVAVEYANFDTSLKIRSPTELGNISSTQQQTCKRIQLAPSLEIGSTILDNYYLGFIVSWRYSRVSTTSLTPIRGAYHFAHEFKLRSYTDAFIKVGYKPLRQLMLYGVAGPSIANWSHTTQQISVNGAQVSKLINEFNMKKKTLGLGLGGGIEYLIKEKYALSFEYVFHTHRSQSANRTISYEDQAPITRASRSGRRTRSGSLTKIVQPSYSTFAIRLTYFFNL